MVTRKTSTRYKLYSLGYCSRPQEGLNVSLWPKACQRQTTATSSNSFDFNQLQSQISELTEVVAAIASKQPFDFSKIKCYRCNEFGHFQNKCPTHLRNNPGPNRRFPRQTRHQGRNAFRGASRAQYPIETDQNESPDQEEEHEEHDPWITGNY